MAASCYKICKYIKQQEVFDIKIYKNIALNLLKEQAGQGGKSTNNY